MTESELWLSPNFHEDNRTAQEKGLVVRIGGATKEPK